MGQPKTKVRRAPQSVVYAQRAMRAAREHSCNSHVFLLCSRVSSTGCFFRFYGGEGGVGGRTVPRAYRHTPSAFLTPLLSSSTAVVARGGTCASPGGEEVSHPPTLHLFVYISSCTSPACIEPICTEPMHRTDGVSRVTPQVRRRQVALHSEGRDTGRHPQPAIERGPEGESAEMERATHTPPSCAP
jgi:hypothetical protein